jgi:adenylate cyclase
VRYATEDAYLGDDSLFPYATRLAMGLAILRSQNLDAEVNQVAVWDSAPPTGLAGTAVDVAYWRSKGRRTDVIPVTPFPGFIAAAAAPAARAGAMPPRRTHALLFGDFHGYSTLRDRDIAAFQQTFMKAVAEILEQFGAGVQYRNTWGDAIYVVMDNVVDAARCALAIRDCVAQLDRGDLAVRPELRLAGHFGPTFEGYDAVRGEPTYFGAQVTRAARLEPVTPTNLVYVTEQFAAALLLENATQFSCDYVGQLPAAKNYGTMPMYMLRAAY